MEKEVIKGAEKFTILSAFGNVEQKYFIQPVRNPETGMFADHVRAVNSKGEMILSEEDKLAITKERKVFVPENKTYEIYSGMEIDLNNPAQKAMWEAIQFCPGIATDRYQKDADGNYVIDGNAERYGIAELYIENPTLEAKKEVSKDKSIFEAKKLIYEDSIKGRLSLATILGRKMDGYSDYDVTDFLIKFAERNPEKIKMIYTGDELSLRILFLKAKEKDIIRVSGKTYVYGDEGQYILGSTDDAAISFLKMPANKNIVEQIRVELDPTMFNKEINKEDDSENKESESFNSVEDILNNEKEERKNTRKKNQ